MAFKRSAVRLRSAPPVSRQGFGNEALFSFERALCAFALLLLLVAVAPARAQEQVTFDKTDLAIVTSGGGRHVFKADWAKTWPQKAHGLMFRKQLPLDQGMLLDDMNAFLAETRAAGIAVANLPERATAAEVAMHLKDVARLGLLRA